MKRKGKERDRKLGDVLGEMMPRRITDIEPMVMAHIRGHQKRYNPPVNVTAYMEMEAKGGACLRCGRKWEQVRVKNQFADFAYYQPACDCYRRCPQCDRSLHIQEEWGKLRCSCGWTDEKPAQERDVRDYRRKFFRHQA